MTAFEKYLGTWLLNSGEVYCDKCVYRTPNGHEGLCENLREHEDPDDDICLQGMREFFESTKKVGSHHQKSQGELMKDYRLSEIKNGDWRDGDSTKSCGEFLRELQYDLENEDIEPRDMIELPCKELRTESFGNIWDVYHRNAKYGFIQHEYFNTEAEADAFLARLRGDKE